MILEYTIQFASVTIALVALYIGRHGMKNYLPVGLFASFYANLICSFMVIFQWWHFHADIVGNENISFPANFVVVPILAMFWVRFCPHTITGRIAWGLLWSIPLSLAEFAAEKYTKMIKYHNGYDWYFTLLWWMGSWFIWLTFHNWLMDEKRRKP